MLDKINQSNSEVGGDQIAGDKNTYNINQNNITQNINQNIGNMLYDSDADIFREDFNEFLENTELSVLSYEKIRLSDLYIPIELKDEYSNKKISIEVLMDMIEKKS
ncbi:hypothetical protein OFR37_05585 [Brachyspira hyodysenteriae]|uniref:hypothetical protein n=1 Tax=Brachyspira hyodysenteriae TaxID=159 RepID=UPI0022CD3F22|nr:hypothetical protein [Brachyspira hyodysenteriae]MDA0054376.1 hypothetical protein [Brachyspira hyodysenteriae]